MQLKYLSLANTDKNVDKQKSLDEVQHKYNNKKNNEHFMSYVIIVTAIYSSKIYIYFYFFCLFNVFLLKTLNNSFRHFQWIYLFVYLLHSLHHL